jgi:hypothetical protein
MVEIHGYYGRNKKALILAWVLGRLSCGKLSMGTPKKLIAGLTGNRCGMVR